MLTVFVVVVVVVYVVVVVGFEKIEIAY